MRSTKWCLAEDATAIELRVIGTCTNCVEHRSDARVSVNRKVVGESGTRHSNDAMTHPNPISYSVFGTREMLTLINQLKAETSVLQTPDTRRSAGLKVGKERASE